MITVKHYERVEKSRKIWIGHEYYHAVDVRFLGILIFRRKKFIRAK